MAISTEQLIQQLSLRAEPVSALSSPLRRTFIWLSLVGGIVALPISALGFRPDLIEAMAGTAEGMEWVGSFLTGILAAYAVFQISVPGRSRYWALLPVPAMFLWLSSLGMGCLGDWMAMGPAAFSYQATSWHCSREILSVSLPIGLALLIMIRHAGVVRPAMSALLGAIGAAALSAAGVSLFHNGETAMMMLIWHLGTVAIFSFACWQFNRKLFSWVGS